MLTPTEAQLRTALDILTPGTVYGPPAGHDATRWRDAYYRRLVASELPEMFQFLEQYFKEPMYYLSLTLLPEILGDAEAEAASKDSFFTYVPGRLITTFDKDLTVPEPNFRLRLLRQADLKAYHAEPSDVELFEVLGDKRVEGELEYQAMCVDNIDKYATQMRNIIIDEFFMDNISVFALLRTQYCFAKSYCERAADVFRSYKEEQDKKKEPTSA